MENVIVKGLSVAVRKGLGEGVNAEHVERVGCRRVADIEHALLAYGGMGIPNAIVRDVHGTALLESGNIYLFSAAVELLGRPNVKVAGMPNGADESRSLLREGMPFHYENEVLECGDGPLSHCFTHAVITRGGSFESISGRERMWLSDPVDVVGLCAGDLADLLHGVEIGLVGKDGSVEWPGLYLDTVPVDYED